MSAKPTSWPAPIAFEDATCVQDLADRIRDPDGAIYALRLWHHRRRLGATIAGDNADGTIERVCGWRRKRGQLVAALVGAGLVTREADGSLTIRPWEEVAFVDWTRSGGREQVEADGETADEEEDAAVRRRRLDRERKAAAYAEKRKTSAETAENSPRLSAPTAENSPHVSAPSAEKDGPDTCSTRATVTGTETATKTEAKTHVAAAATTGLTPPANRTEAGPKTDRVEAQITEVLEHWRVAVDRVGWAITGKGSEKRRSRIRARLDEGLSVDDLKRAADGAALDDWLMGRDPKSTKAGGWRDVDTVFRDRPQVERLIETARCPPRPSARAARYDPKTTDYSGTDNRIAMENLGFSPEEIAACGT